MSKEFQKKYHYVYKLSNPNTGEYYFGSRSCKCVPSEDKYMGSMVVWRPDKNLLIKEIVNQSFTERNDALLFEKRIIAEHINDELNRNYAIPGEKFIRIGPPVNKGIKNPLHSEFMLKNSPTRGKGDFGVVQYDRFGNMVRVWDSISTASNVLNISYWRIKGNLAGRSFSAGGFIWKRFDENFLKKIEIGKVGHYKKILQISLLDGSVIKEWNSVTDAASYYNVRNSNIVDCLKGRYKSSCGYKWEYLDEKR